MNKFRTWFDAVLHKHEIDVCRLMAVSLYCAAAGRAWNMVVRAYFGSANCDLTIILSLVMAFAFARRKSWPRKVGIFLLWIVTVAVGAALLFFTFNCWASILPPQPWRINGVEFTEPPGWLPASSIVALVVIFFVGACDLLLLHSKKIREEIAAANHVPAPLTRANRWVQGLVIASAVMGAIATTVFAFACQGLPREHEGISYSRS